MRTVTRLGSSRFEIGVTQRHHGQLMPRLDGMQMTFGQDQDVLFTQTKSGSAPGNVSDERLADTLLQSITDDFDLVCSNAHRGPR